MALDKQSLPINFSMGLETKADPRQIDFGKFLVLENTIFDRQGLLQKRNGFKELADLPDYNSLYTTTFNGNLTALGPNFYAYSEGANVWVNRGKFYPLKLSTLPLVRNNTTQSQGDVAVSSNGLACVAYTDNVPSGGVNVPVYKFAVLDSITGQYIISPTEITVSGGQADGSPRVFILKNFFVVVFTALVGVTYSLRYIKIPLFNPEGYSPTPVTLTSNYTPSSTVNFDGVVASDTLYIAFNGNDGGGAVRVLSLSSTFSITAPVIFAGQVATHMSVCADESGSSPIIWANYYDSVSQDAYSLAVNSTLGTILAPTNTYTGADLANIASVAKNGVCTVLVEFNNDYTYSPGVPTNYVEYKTVLQAGTVSSATEVARSVGLASKAFYKDDDIYFLSAYESDYQPSYFLLKLNGDVVSKLAYSNGGGYLDLGLPSVTVINDIVYSSYLYRNLIQAVNKSQGVANSAGIYAQTGVNLVSFEFNVSSLISSEIGQNLNITGGFLWGYDGVKPVEQGFNLWPDNVDVSTNTVGGLITAQQYYYQAVYEWADNQGNIFRSAPSLPVGIVTTGSTSKNTINVPTLRLTYKGDVRITLYRWSTAQQNYYQVTSILVPTLNDKTVDYVTIEDTLADSAILGNSLIYTTGGVVENIGAPSAYSTALFKGRLWLIDSEKRDLLWYSKQVIDSTPVEMSDLFTLFVAPNTAAQGATGPMYAISSLDDKLIIFKKNSIYYVVGNGPDNTGANNDLSEPVFITSTVGCINPNSIVFTPQGLMFQSNGKGIWLLGRDLSTSYVGAPVQAFNNLQVLSAVNVPETNQVRFTLSGGITLMYDYYYAQWGTFTNIPAISSTIFDDMHTYINKFGQVYQENPGSYVDGSKPTLISFTTGWLNLAGLQGFERSYFFYLLGTYLSPHKLSIRIAYDYEESYSQSVLVSPSNYDGFYGDYPIYGSSESYSKSAVEQWRIFFERQKCQAFKISVSEVYDPSMGASPGAGFTMSGINMIYAGKKSYVPLRSANSAG